MILPFSLRRRPSTTSWESTLKRSSLCLSSSSVCFCSVMSYWPEPVQWFALSVPDELRLVVHPHHSSVAGDQAVLHPIGLAGLVVLTSSASTRPLSSGCNIPSQCSSSTISALAG